MIRDGGMAGENITIFETAPLLGGALDAAGNARDGYSMRGGRMLTTDNYECFWDLYTTIPSLNGPDMTVYDEVIEFNKIKKAHSKARLVDRNHKIVDVTSMGFTMRDRAELLKLTETSEDKLGNSLITDWLSPEFFTNNFWYMWQTTFAFEPWHSAVEFKRYLHRFMKEFSRIETLAGVKRTIYNQYDALVRPLVKWLDGHGVQFQNDSTVIDIELSPDAVKHTVVGLTVRQSGSENRIVIDADDLVFFQNASMTDATSLSSMTRAPQPLTKADSGGWRLWEKLAEGHPEFGNPLVFNSSIPESYWHSFMVTLKDTSFFDQMEQFTGNQAGTGGLVTFKDSNWLMSVVLYHQPHFINQPAGVQVLWGYALYPGRIGNYVAKPMSECTGEEILRELCGHLNFDMGETFSKANCIPCRMPYITTMFMPRVATDRPIPVPKNSANLAFVSQFVEIPEDVVFTVEYSVRAAQMAVYELLNIDREVPKISHYDKSVKVNFDAVLKAFK